MVFLAPGAGLGHLVRTLSLAIELKNLKIPTLIVATSRWSYGLSRLTGIPVHHIPPGQWVEVIPTFLKRVEPALVVRDSFPFGFRGEDFLECADQTPFVYLARRLNIDAYFTAINQSWIPGSPFIASTIILEELSETHYKLIETSAQNITVLDGRIQFPASQFAPPVPKNLQKLIDTSYLHLVVHSGPRHEVNKLIRLAKESIQHKGKGSMAVINPLMAAEDCPDTWDFFPAAALFPDVYRIYTGAGYNSIAEGTLFADKHVAIPFPRYYDDQKARLQNSQSSTIPGNEVAAKALLKS